jgi:hypothetical protein
VDDGKAQVRKAMDEFLEIDNEYNFSDLDEEDENDESKGQFPEIEIPRNYSFRHFYNVYNYLSA